MKSKFIYIVVALFLTTYVFAENYDNILLKGGYSFNGEMETSKVTTVKSKTKGSSEIALEYSKHLFNGFYAGIGAGVEDAIELENSVVYPIYFIPVYGTAKLKIGLTQKTKLYILAKGGYSIPYVSDKNLIDNGNGEVTGGLNYGAGAGIEAGNIYLEALYKMTNFEIKSGNDVYKYALARYSVGVGISFDIFEKKEKIKTKKVEVTIIKEEKKEELPNETK